MYQSPVLRGKEYIVRQVNVSDELVYMMQADDLGCFARVRMDTVVWFELMKGMEVKDFEVDGTMVYFCGSMGNDALVGKFDYNKVLSTMENNVLIIPLQGGSTTLSVLEPTAKRQVSFDCNLTVRPRFALAGYDTSADLTVYYMTLPSASCLPSMQRRVYYGRPVISKVMSNPEAPYK